MRVVDTERLLSGWLRAQPEIVALVEDRVYTENPNRAVFPLLKNKPELVKKIAKLLGGDPDLLFRLATSTDPDIAEYLHLVPNVPEFLRTAMTLRLTSDDFAELIEEVKKRRSTVPQS